MDAELLQSPLFLLASFSIAVAAILFLRPHADRLGLIDLPDARKRHGEAVPLIGGVGIAFAVCLTGLLLEYDRRAYSAFLVAALPLLLTGLRDDRLGLSATQRFWSQVVAALIMVFGAKLDLQGLGDLVGLGPITTGWAAVPFTVFCVVGLINAFNMADGVDGLAGSLGLVSATSLALVAFADGAVREFELAVVLCGALLGFLLFNLDHRWRPARVFMGDAGSMFLGFVLVWLAIALTQRGASGAAALYPISAVWILGLPILDTIATMMRRVQIGHSPFAPDRSHLHHLLQARGWRTPRVVMVEVVVATAFAVVGILGYAFHVGEPVLAAGFVVVAIGYWRRVSRLWAELEADEGAEITGRGREREARRRRRVPHDQRLAG